MHISAQTAGDFGLIRPPVSGQSATDFGDFATRFGPIRLSCGLRAPVSDLRERLIPSSSATGVAGRGGMAQKRSEMRRVKEVLRLRLAFGLSHKAISAACRMPRTTVRDYCQRAKAAGIAAWPPLNP